jgi:cyclopropane fatty-acyl-phospholipid synthase-like methyltransferase
MVLFESALWSCWAELENSIRSGKPARPADMYQHDPADTERFIRAMHSLVAARGDAEILAKTLDLKKVSHLLDLGSGPATYPIAFCQRHPQLDVTIFDLPGTLNITRRFIRESKLEDRISLAAGDYRVDPIPGKYELIFLSNIIHSESSEENQRLMSKLYHSLDKGGKIIIKDHVVETDRTTPAVGAIFSMLMLLTTTAGRCYSLDEVRQWLIQAGFENISEISLPPPLTSSLVVGEKN